MIETLKPQEDKPLILPPDPYDLRCIDCELVETKEAHLPMLAFKYEIAAPITKVPIGGSEPVEIAGKEIRDWIVFYGSAITQLEAQDALSEEDEKRLTKYKSLKNNPSFGSLAKLGSIHLSMGLPMEIDEATLEPNQYIGKTLCANLYSERDAETGSDGKPLTDISGKPCVRYNLRLKRYVGPARWPEQHQPY
jgi:hypothetical protein